MIAVSVPAGTDVTALVPTIVVSAEATVNPASGVETDFTNPVTYTITAENSDTQVYTVTVTVTKPVPTIELVGMYTSPGIDLTGITLSGNPKSGLDGLHADLQPLFKDMPNAATVEFVIATLRIANCGDKGVKMVKTNKAMNTLYGDGEYEDDQKISTMTRRQINRASMRSS